MGVPALGLINFLAHRFGSTKTERAIFTNYALQSLHTTSQRGVAALCRKLQPLPLGPAILSPGVTVHHPGVPPRRPTGLPVLRQVSTVPSMPWQLAAAIKAIRLVSARNAVQGAVLMAPPATTLTIHTRAPVIALALALAQLLPQIHELAAWLMPFLAA
jgi:hypothetical protein